MSQKVVVLLSGGLDSAMVLAMLAPYYDCVALGFDYGQAHRKELLHAEAVADWLRVPFTRVRFEGLSGGLLSGGRNGADCVIPDRNLRFLGGALARFKGIRRVAIGANADDAAVFEDCRPEVLEQEADRLGVTLLMPIAETSKRDAYRAFSFQYRRMLRFLTWSCYEGKDIPCAVCDACVARNHAFGARR